MYQTVWRRMGTRLGGRGRIAVLSVGEGGGGGHGRGLVVKSGERHARNDRMCRAGMHHIPQDDATPGLEGGPHGNNVGIGATSVRGVRRALPCAACSAACESLVRAWRVWSMIHAWSRWALMVHGHGQSFIELFYIYKRIMILWNMESAISSVVTSMRCVTSSGVYTRMYRV